MINNVSYADDLYKSIKLLSDKVLIKKLKTDDLRKVDGVYIPISEKYKNLKIGVGQIIDIGDDAIEKYGVNVNDYVLYDYYSAHGDYNDSIITNAENLIVKISEEEAYKFLNSGL